MLGPYIKCRGTGGGGGGTKMSANTDLITVETRENNWKPVFHIWVKMLKYRIFLAILASMIRLGLSCFPAILLPLSMYMCNNEAIWLELFLSSNPKYEQNIMFDIWGVLGGPLRQSKSYQIFRTVRPHHKTNIHNKGKIISTSLSYVSPNVKKLIFFLFGDPGWLINNQTGPILLPSYPLTYIKLHIKYGTNLFKKLLHLQRNVCGRGSGCGVMTTKK